MNRVAALWPLLVLVVSTVVWSAIFLPFFPTRQGTLGHDMGYFMPMLVEGYAGLKQNGFFSPPAFSPSFCAGLPFYGSPQAIPYSITGLLLFVTDPIGALRGTLVVMHVVAWAGTYLVSRLVLRVDRASSTLGAVLFAWTSVVLDRALAGHWNFVAYGTTSVALLGVGLAAREGGTRRDVAVGAALFGLTVAYWLEAALAVAAVPLGLCAVAFVFVVVLRGGSLARGAVGVAAGGALAFLLSAPKLIPMMAFLKQAPRDLYALPGYEHVVDAVRGVFTVVFLEPHHIEDPGVLIPVMYREVERAWSLGPVGLLAWGAVIAGVWRARRVAWTPSRIAALVGLVVVLALPVVLTVQNEALFAFVKHVPFLKSTWSFTRWYCIYAPLAALASGLLVHQALVDERLRVALAVLLSGVVMALHASVDRSGAHRELYDLRPMLALKAAVDDGQRLPDITRVATPQKTSPVSFIMWNSAFASGTTTVPCYEPLFGYELERFPGKVQEGPADLVVDGRTNLLDPRCMLYPEENRCAPGDHLRADDPAAQAFPRREPIAFEAPLAFKLGAWLRALGFLVAAALLATGGSRSRVGAPRRGEGAGDSPSEEH